jgi:hypothetical protein
MDMNSAQSPLLKLPAELRNKIFAYAMGNYDVYIEPFNKTKLLKSRTLDDGGHECYTAYVDYRLVTTILPHGEDYRPAAPGDDLPNFSLPRVCRQLYGETSLLPYTLNHFKFLHRRYRGLGKNSGKYSGPGNYNTLDLWLERRLPVHVQVMSSIAPPLHYISNYYSGMRPAFSSRFPGLQKLDLSAAFFVHGTEPSTKWEQRAQKKDTRCEIEVVHPTRYYARRVSRDTIGDGPNHFDVIIKAVDLDV